MHETIDIPLERNPRGVESEDYENYWYFYFLIFYKCVFSVQPSPTRLGRALVCFEQLRQLLQLDHLSEFLDVENKIFSPFLLHILSFLFFCQVEDLCPAPRHV